MLRLVYRAADDRTTHRLARLTGFVISIALGVAGLSAAPAAATTSDESVSQAVERAVAGFATIDSAAAGVSIPRDPRDGVQLTGSRRPTVQVSLPVARGMASRHGNTTIYAGDEDSGIAVQPTGRGAVRILVAMNNRRAPANYDFPRTLPAAAELLPDGRGGFDIVLVQAKSPLIGIGHVAAPWASDAQGKPAATGYTLRGHTISQRIEVNAHTAYPVVADPSIGVGWYIYVKYSKSEVASVAQKSWWAGASTAAGYACGMIPAVGWGAR